MNDDDLIDSVFAAQADRPKEAAIDPVALLSYEQQRAEQIRDDLERAERQFRLLERQTVVMERQLVLGEQQNQVWARVASALEKLVSK